MFRYLLDCLRAGANQRAGLAAAVVLCVAGSPAWGLGLGEIDLDSALNEPLDARIELVDVEGLQPVDIMVSLASPQDFQRVGVERFFFLTDLRFEVDYADGAPMSVRVRSSQPITEPYLNFLVEVLWPSGRMLKEYTLLLDPPTFSPTPAPAVAAPERTEQAAADSARIQRSEAPARASRGTEVAMPAASASAPRPASPLDQGMVDGEYRMTDRTDTLWSIASRTRASRAVSVKQQMLALQRMNPEAFLQGNINLLKAGYNLQLPSESEALSVSEAEATQLVAMQSEDWRALQQGGLSDRAVAERMADAADRPAADLQSQVDATPQRQAPAPAPATAGGELRIVASAGEGVAGGGVAGAADERLAITLEEQDRLAREVDELNSALARERELASNQIAVKDRQLEVRDQQMAQMQAEVERLRQELAAATQNQNQNTSNPPLAWWQSPYLIGGGAGLLVLLLALVLVQARRRSTSARGDYAEPTLRVPGVGAAAAAAGIAAVHAAPAAAVAGPGDAPDSQASTHAATTTERDPAPTGAETSDVIGEADIYIAYGRYPQAIALLSGVLQDEPYRNEVRLKLLELFAETRDREAFEEHAAELQDRCRDEATLAAARELRRPFESADADLDLEAHAGSVADTELVLDDELLDAAASNGQDAAADPLGGALRVDDDREPDALDFEELELVELDQQDDRASGDSSATSASPDMGGFELELDEVLLDEIPGEAANGATASATAGELGGDLGIEFDPDRVDAQQSPAPVDAAAAAIDETPLDSDVDLELDGDLELELDLDRDLAAELDDPAPDHDEFGFEDDGDTTSTKLDLARAYIDMGDQDGARDILGEVVMEGNAEQKRRAEAMLAEL